MLTPDRCTEIMKQAQKHHDWIDKLRDYMTQDEIDQVNQAWDNLHGSWWNAFDSIRLDPRRHRVCETLGRIYRYGD